MSCLTSQIVALRPSILKANEDAQSKFASLCIVCLGCWFTIAGTGYVIAGTIHETFDYEGHARNYRLHVPSSYSNDTSWPLVLSLHGRGSDPDRTAELSKMDDVSEREGFLVAYPSAVDRSWTNESHSNIGYLDALLDKVSSEFSVDASRVYATGASQGAIWTYVLGVTRPERIAAIAPHSGTRLTLSDGSIYPAPVPRVPDRPVPLFHLHGTADFSIPYEGGGSPSFFSVEDVLSTWAANNQCDMTPRTLDRPDNNPNDSLSVSIVGFDNCATYVGESGTERNAEVTHYRINGGGHNFAENSAEEIWQFFSRHELPTTANDVELGDFNRDGMLNAPDIDLLSAAVGQGDLSFDLTSDGVVDESDRVYWVTQLKGTFFGDANLDGAVNASDLNEIGVHWRATGDFGWARGDFDASGTIDAADLNALGAHWNNGLSDGRGLSVAVPEPSTIASILVGLIGVLGHCRRCG